MRSSRRYLFFSRLLYPILPFLLLIIVSSCEPLATDFDEIEAAHYYYAETTHPVPDTFSVIRGSHDLEYSFWSRQDPMVW